MVVSTKDNSAPKKNDIPLTYDSARIGQKVTMLNSPYADGNIVKKGQFFATVKLADLTKTRRYYSKLVARE